MNRRDLFKMLIVALFAPKVPKSASSLTMTLPSPRPELLVNPLATQIGATIRVMCDGDKWFVLEDPPVRLRDWRSPRDGVAND